MANKVAEMITDKIIDALEKGVAPWRKPWKTAPAQFAANFITKKSYRGINQFLLSMSGFSSPFWLTYKQAAELGGNVRKGEKGTPIIYVGSVKDEQDETKYTFLRYFTVFNTDQCEGLDKHLPVAPVVATHNKIEAAEALVERYSDKPAVTRANAAWYRPSTDIVGLPLLSEFESADTYYSTLFHEFAHSTGHESRLNREGVAGAPTGFGSELYGKEELVAELTAAFLCAESGIDNIPASASYCKSWITTLKGDPKLVISAAAAAQRAFEYITKKEQAAA